MTKTTEENLSQSKYAEHRNVTKGYIGRMVKEGRLHLIKGKLNVKMSDAELDNKSNDEKAPNYWIEKALHEKAKRELAELDLKLKQDQLVEVDQVGLHLDLIFSAVRQRLLATPSKIAPLVHAEESVGGARIVLESAVFEVLVSYRNMSPLNKRLRKSIELLKPPPKQTVSEWAVANRILSSEASAESGKYHFIFNWVHAHYSVSSFC